MLFRSADFLHVCIRFAVPAVLLFRFVWRGPCVVTALVLRVVPFLLFIAVGMMLFVFGFEPFILRLYRGVLFERSRFLSVSSCSMALTISSLVFPIRAYETFSKVLRHLPPQLIVEVVFFHRRQE